MTEEEERQLELLKRSMVRYGLQGMVKVGSRSTPMTGRASRMSGSGQSRSPAGSRLRRCC